MVACRTLAKSSSANGNISAAEARPGCLSGLCVQRETHRLALDRCAVQFGHACKTMTGKGRHPVPSSSPRACRRVEGICRNVIVSGDTARSYNLPISLIKFAASQKERGVCISRERRRRRALSQLAHLSRDRETSLILRTSCIHARHEPMADVPRPKKTSQAHRRVADHRLRNHRRIKIDFFHTPILPRCVPAHA